MEKKYPIGSELEIRTKAEKWFDDELKKISHPITKATICDHKEAFIGSWMQGYMAKEAPTGPVWVKASERLPEKSGYYYVKRKVVKSTEQEKDIQYYHTDSGRFSWDNVIEWLDEGE